MTGEYCIENSYTPAPHTDTLYRKEVVTGEHSIENSSTPAQRTDAYKQGGQEWGAGREAVTGEYLLDPTRREEDAVAHRMGHLNVNQHSTQNDMPYYPEWNSEVYPLVFVCSLGGICVFAFGTVCLLCKVVVLCE